MNESCHTYKWVMSHIWMSMSHTNESFHIWRMEVTLFTLVNPERSLRFNTHWSSPPVSALTQPGGVTSCHTYEWVMSHIWMSHVTHMNESCHIWMSHLTHMNVTHLSTQKEFMSHRCMSHVMYERDTLQMRMSHVTYKWVKSHICFDVTHKQLTFRRVISMSINDSIRTLKWLICNSHIDRHWSDSIITHILIDIDVTHSLLTYW